MRNFKILPLGHTRALTVHFAWEGGNLNVALEGWGIWTRFISFSDVILSWFVFRFLQGLVDLQDRISPLVVNNSFKRVFKRSLKVSSWHISALKSVNSVWLKTKFVFEERYFNTNWWSIRTVFLPWSPGGNLNDPTFKSSNARGLLLGGCWSFKLIGALTPNDC